MSTTEQNRSKLIKMANGNEDKALLFYVGYLLIAVPMEVAAAYDMHPTPCCFILPCEHNAIQSICDVQEARQREHRRSSAPEPYDDSNGVKWQVICTWQNYDDTATDDEVAAAMATAPCLVNYGGTLRAVNAEGSGTPVIITKDMQRI